MNYVYMYFSSPATYPNVIDTTIRDSYLMTSIDHRMSYQDKATIATKELLVPRPLDVYVVYGFNTMDHITTLVVYKPCQLMIICKIELRQK